MYLGQMTCEIGIGDKYRLRGANAIEVKKSVHQIVQTAKVQLPLSVLFRNEKILERIQLIDKIKEGDAITIAFGYKGNNKTEFTGYIKRINHKQPLELECEDEMSLLRKLYLKKSFVRNDVKDIIQYLSDEVYKAFNVRLKVYEEMPKVEVRNFVINGQNGLWVLQALADKYLQASYLTTINGERVLYCGLTYLEHKDREVKYVINKNTVNVDDLKFNPDVNNVKMVVKLKRRDGTTKELVYGDSDAEVVENFAPPAEMDEATIERVVKEAINRKKANGYTGSLQGMIFPYIEPGYRVELNDLQFANRYGKYYIGTVTTNFDTGGGKRKVEIDFKIHD